MTGVVLLTSLSLAADGFSFCKALLEGGWEMVSHVDDDPMATSFPSDTLSGGGGTFGTPSNPPTSTDGPWSVSFDPALYNDFMFSSGDCTKWVAVAIDQFTGVPYSTSLRPSLGSNLDPTPHPVEISNTVAPEDPTVSDPLTPRLYAEVPRPRSAYQNQNEGLNVWIRKTPIPLSQLSSRTHQYVGTLVGYDNIEDTAARRMVYGMEMEVSIRILVVNSEAKVISISVPIYTPLAALRTTTTTTTCNFGLIGTTTQMRFSCNAVTLVDPDTLAIGSLYKYRIKMSRSGNEMRRDGRVVVTSAPSPLTPAVWEVDHLLSYIARSGSSIEGRWHGDIDNLTIRPYTYTPQYTGAAGSFVIPFAFPNTRIVVMSGVKQAENSFEISISSRSMGEYTEYKFTNIVHASAVDCDIGSIADNTFVLVCLLSGTMEVKSYTFDTVFADPQLQTTVVVPALDVTTGRAISVAASKDSSTYAVWWSDSSGTLRVVGLAVSDHSVVHPAVPIIQALVRSGNADKPSRLSSDANGKVAVVVAEQVSCQASSLACITSYSLDMKSGRLIGNYHVKGTAGAGSNVQKHPSLKLLDIGQFAVSFVSGDNTIVLSLLGDIGYPETYSYDLDTSVGGKEATNLAQLSTGGVQITFLLGSIVVVLDTPPFKLTFNTDPFVPQTTNRKEITSDFPSHVQVTSPGGVSADIHSALFVWLSAAGTAMHIIYADVPQYNGYSTCEVINEGAWVKVRHIGSGIGWYSFTDSLSGVPDIGTPAEAAVISIDLAEWTIPWNGLPNDEFLFSSGDCKNWVQATSQSVIGGTPYTLAIRDVIASNLNPFPHQLAWSNDANGPTLSNINLVGSSTEPLLYREGSNDNLRILDDHGGSDVWIRLVPLAFADLPSQDLTLGTAVRQYRSLRLTDSDLLCFGFIFRFKLTVNVFSVANFARIFSMGTITGNSCPTCSAILIDASNRLFVEIYDNDLNGIAAINPPPLVANTEYTVEVQITRSGMLSLSVGQMTAPVLAASAQTSGILKGRTTLDSDLGRSGYENDPLLNGRLRDMEIKTYLKTDETLGSTPDVQLSAVSMETGEIVMMFAKAASPYDFYIDFFTTSETGPTFAKTEQMIVSGVACAMTNVWNNVVLISISSDRSNLQVRAVTVPATVTYTYNYPISLTLAKHIVATSTWAGDVAAAWTETSGFLNLFLFEWYSLFRGSIVLENDGTIVHDTPPSIASNGDIFIVVAERTSCVPLDTDNCVMMYIVSHSGALLSSGMLNTETTNLQRQPSIACLRDGSFFAAYVSGDQILGRPISRSGTLGDEINVSNNKKAQGSPHVAAMVSPTAFVVNYRGLHSVLYQVFNNGAKLGSEVHNILGFRKDTGAPIAVANGNSEFLVLWTSGNGAVGHLFPGEVVSGQPPTPAPDTPAPETSAPSTPVPDKTDMRLNLQDTYHRQVDPATASFSDGSFVVAYSTTNLAAPRLVLRFYSARGVLTSVRMVYDSAVGDQSYPDVAVARDDTLHIVWQKTVGYQVSIRHATFNPSSCCSATTISTSTLVRGGRPKVACTADNTMIVWEAYITTEYEIRGFILGVSTTDFVVNSGTGPHMKPAIAAISIYDPTNQFVIAWQGLNSRWDVLFRWINGAGVFQDSGDEVLNGVTDGSQKDVAIGTGIGGHLLCWLSLTGGDGSNENGIYATTFSVARVKLQDEFTIQRSASGFHRSPAVVGLPCGHYSIAWQYSAGVGSFYDIYYSVLDVSAGVMNKKVDTVGDYNEGTPAITSYQHYGSVIVYGSSWEDGSGDGINFALFGTYSKDFTTIFDSELRGARVAAATHPTAGTTLWLMSTSDNMDSVKVEVFDSCGSSIGTSSSVMLDSVPTHVAATGFGTEGRFSFAAVRYDASLHLSTYDNVGSYITSLLIDNNVHYPDILWSASDPTRLHLIAAFASGSIRLHKFIIGSPHVADGAAQTIAGNHRNAKLHFANGELFMTYMDGSTHIPSILKIGGTVGVIGTNAAFDVGPAVGVLPDRIWVSVHAIENAAVGGSDLVIQLFKIDFSSNVVPNSIQFVIWSNIASTTEPKVLVLVDYIVVAWVAYDKFARRSFVMVAKYDFSLTAMSEPFVVSEDAPADYDHIGSITLTSYQVNSFMVGWVTNYKAYRKYLSGYD